MTFEEFDRYDAVGLAALIRQGEVSEAEILDTALRRIETGNPSINAVVLRMDEAARKAVADGVPQGPLTGVPTLLKDLAVHCAGTPTTDGSLLVTNKPADHDSAVTVGLKRAGMVIAGKTNSSEFGLSTTTEPRRYGATRNPWNLEFSPGGSSGGAAAAVAAGMVPLAQASDGGGSIRIPAACCGLFGLKPTRGRVSLAPDRGEGWAGSSVLHAISRSVRDSAAVLDAIAGPAPGDPYWAAPPRRPFSDEVGADPGRLRVALCTTTFNGAPVDEACVEAARSAAQFCADLGHVVEDARPHFDAEEFRQSSSTVIATNVAAAIEARAVAIGRACRPDEVEKMTWSMVERGRAVTGIEYLECLQTLHRIGRIVGRFFEDHDVLLSPTMAVTAIPLGWLDMMTDDPESYRDRIVRTIGFTSLFNASGNPAMSVPLAWSRKGLPIGVQFATKMAGEALLFRLAAQLEKAKPWFNARPGGLP